VKRRASVWLVLGVSLGIALAAGAQTSARRPWIDVHMHLVGGAKGDFSGAAREALAMMYEARIRTAVVMPPPFTSTVANRHEAANFLEALKARPRRFAHLGGGGTLNLTLERTAGWPAIDAQTRTEFERAAREILDAGASGFGEIAVHHLSLVPGHPYEWIAADHPLLLILADIAAEGDAVIDLHLDVVPRDMALPARFLSPPNPGVL
jgi:hypothetical protein